MLDTHHPHSTTLLVRWALKTRAFQERARKHSPSDTGLRLWLLKPLSHVAALAALVLLTYLAGALRPKLLYGATETGATDDTQRQVFLDYRAFLLTLFAAFGLLTGQSMIDALKEDPEFASMPFAAQQATVLVLPLFMVALGVPQVWVGSRVARAPLTFGQSMRVSGYGVGMLWLTIVILVPLALPWAFDVWYSTLPIAVRVPAATLIVILIFMCIIYVTFVGPVSAFYPKAGKGRLWLGWFIGWLCLTLGPVVLLVVGFLLLALVFAIFGLAE